MVTKFTPSWLQHLNKDDYSPKLNKNIPIIKKNQNYKKKCKNINLLDNYELNLFNFIDRFVNINYANIDFYIEEFESDYSEEDESEYDDDFIE